MFLINVSYPTHKSAVFKNVVEPTSKPALWLEIQEKLKYVELVHVQKAKAGGFSKLEKNVKQSVVYMFLFFR